MAEEDGDFVTCWALHIHEVVVGALHQVFHLGLLLFLFWGLVEEVLQKGHVLVRRSSPQESLWRISASTSSRDTVYKKHSILKRKREGKKMYQYTLLKQNKEKTKIISQQS